MEWCGECLCSHPSLDCLLNWIYFNAWLAFSVQVASCMPPCSPVTLLSSYYRFLWNLFIGPLMLRDDFLPQHSLLLSFHHWKNRTATKEKEVCVEVWSSIHPFIFETQTHAGSYLKKISPGLPTQPSSDFICRAMQPDTPTRALFW